MTRKERLLSLLDSSIDAMLVTNTKNQYYLTGFDFLDGYVLITREKSYLLTDFRYIEAAREETHPDYEIISMSGSRKDLFQELLASNGVKRIAFEEDDLTYSQKKIFENLFEGYTMVPSGNVIGKMRVVKDADEIEKIIKAQRIAEAAFDHILGYITPQRTEVDIALELEFFMRSHGAKSVSFDTIAVSGSASSRPHGVPRNVRLEEGFLTMDFGALYCGYCSDMTRTVVVGKCTEEMKKVYNTVLNAQLEALNAYAIGKTGKEIDKVARDIINGAGYEGCFGHGLGHGVGMYIHESPRVSPTSDRIMEKGHIITIEPGIYLKGKYGVRIEDMMAIGEKTAVNLTKAPKNLIEL